MVHFSIHVPKDTLWSPQAASALIRSILEDKQAGLGLIRFILFGSVQGVEFLIALDDKINAEYLQTLIRAFYPQAEVIPWTFSGESTYPYYRQSLNFERNTALYYQRLATADQVTSPSPLALLAQSISQLRPQEYFFYIFQCYNSFIMMRMKSSRH